MPGNKFGWLGVLNRKGQAGQLPSDTATVAVYGYWVYTPVASVPLLFTPLTSSPLNPHPSNMNFLARSARAVRPVRMGTMITFTPSVDQL